MKSRACSSSIIGAGVPRENWHRLSNLPFRQRKPLPVASSMKLSFLLSALYPFCCMAGTIDFDNTPAGSLPPNWTATQTGKGKARWAVVQDDSAPSKSNVLKQSGEATFPVCVKTDAMVTDGFVEVKFKPISGKEDQAGGIIWRYKDENNYYVTRANALEDNVTIYHTIKGKRVAFKNVNTKVSPATWHTLRVDFIGNKFTVAFDGKKVIEATDNSFSDAGEVGVWTKADSVTLFDDF